MYIFSGGQGKHSIEQISEETRNMTLKRSTSQMTRGNLTVVKATLGREATIKCVAMNLVGQKTVCISILLVHSVIQKSWENKWCQEGARNGARKVPGMVPDRCRNGAKRVPKGCQNGARKVQERYRKGDRKVPKGCLKGA